MAQANRRRGGTNAHHRPLAPLAQATGFVTDRTRLRSTVVTETLAVALPPKAASAGLDFEELYRSSRDDLYAYTAALVRDRGAAEEVTAAAFERAYRRRRTFNPRRGSPRAWLFGIARNAALDELRRRRRVAELAADPEDVEGSAPEEGAERAAARAAVRVALGGLEPRERELIALKFFAGLSNRELARVLDVSESNAGTLLHRAVTKLRKACHETA
jgi:RNA polymerase sigma-70 factor, ECF subfamily